MLACFARSLAPAVLPSFFSQSYTCASSLTSQTSAVCFEHVPVKIKALATTSEVQRADEESSKKAQASHSSRHARVPLTNGDKTDRQHNSRSAAQQSGSSYAFTCVCEPPAKKKWIGHVLIFVNEPQQDAASLLSQHTDTQNSLLNLPESRNQECTCCSGFSGLFNQCWRTPILCLLVCLV